MPPSVIAALDDLFFGAKISEAAKRAGVEVRFVKDPRALLAAAAATLPVMIVMDLNCAAVDPLTTIASLKADPALAGVRVIGYLSHVQTELRQKAIDAGCDAVMPRSAFSQDLPRLLAGN